MIRAIPIILGVFVLTGCSTKTTKVFHDIPISIERTQTNHNIKITLGVNNISIPSYLDTNKIVYVQSDGAIVSLRDLRWSAPFGVHMQNTIINQLQHTFPKSTIREYPWGFYKQPLHILRVGIHSFVLQDNILILKASYNISTEHKHNKTLSLKRELTSLKDEAIMYQMIALITQLIDTISQDIAKK